MTVEDGRTVEDKGEHMEHAVVANSSALIYKIIITSINEVRNVIILSFAYIQKAIAGLNMSTSPTKLSTLPLAFTVFCVWC